MDKSSLTVQEQIIAGLADVETDYEMVDGVRRPVTKVIPKPRSSLTPRTGVKINEGGASLYRKQMLERIDKLPSDWQSKLQNGEAQISDKILYAVRDLAGTQVDIFKSDDAKSEGVTNVKQGQYDRPFLVSAIRLLYSSAKTTSRFGDDFPLALAHGEFTIEVDGREVIKEMPVDAMSNAGNEVTIAVTDIAAVQNTYESGRPKGLFVLNNPKMIPAGKDIRFNLKLTASLTSGSVKGMLIGTEVLP